jgi:hypothetical protein
LKYLSDYPELVGEIHPTLNKKDLDPHVISAGSGVVRIWWICKEMHSWESVVRTRVKGSGCPYCARVKCLSGWNDLGTTHPEISKHFNNNRNSISVSEITISHENKLWWTCDHGHEFLSTAKSLLTTRCPVCVSFGALYPSIAEEWDLIKNKREHNYSNKHPESPFDVRPKSNKKVYWNCKQCDHSWIASVSNRVGGRGCPKCRKTNMSQNLKKKKAQKSPLGSVQHLVDRWDYELNDPIDLNTISSETPDKYYFKCKNGHSLLYSVRDLKKNPDRCRDCRTSFIYTKDLDEELNCVLCDVEIFRFPVTRKQDWKCIKCEHLFKDRLSSLESRMRRYGFACPCCAGCTLVPGKNDLKSRYPEIWVTLKHKEDQPKEDQPIDPRSKEKLEWICEDNYEHIYSIPVYRRVQGYSCKICSTIKRSEARSILSAKSNLIPEWIYSLSADRESLKNISASSHKKIEIVYPECNHSRYTSPRNIINHPKCPQCSKGDPTSKAEIEIYKYIKSITCDISIINGDREVLSPKELDIYIPSMKLAFEYNGCYWHDKKRYLNDLLNNTYDSPERQKVKDCILKGINLYHIWEDDYSKYKDNILKHIKHVIFSHSTS